MRLRGELIERPLAHALETGGMRRTHLRHHENIAKRLLVHVAGLNLALLMRTRFGVGKPRRLQGRSAASGAALRYCCGCCAASGSKCGLHGSPSRSCPPSPITSRHEQRRHFRHGLLVPWKQNC